MNKNTPELERELRRGNKQPAYLEDGEMENGAVDETGCQ